MNRRGVVAGLLIATGSLLGPRLAAGATAVSVLAPWARASRQRNTSAFFTIVNRGAEDDRLIRVVSPYAEKCVLQRVVWKGYESSLETMDMLEVPAGKTVELNPSHVRVTILGQTRALSDKDTLPLTLTFARAGRIEVIANVTERMLGMPGFE